MLCFIFHTQGGSVLYVGTKFEADSSIRSKVIRGSQISPRPQTPSWGCGTAKMARAGDIHYLFLQTQFGEDRCTQFRVIVITDPHTTHKHRPPACCKQTGPITIHCAVASAQCNHCMICPRTAPTDGLYTLRASCGAVYCKKTNQSCLWVCVWGWDCYDDNSKLRASILTKLGM